MTISELIKTLSEIKEMNGNMQVNLCVNGHIYSDIEFNCPDANSPLYIEGYEEE